MESLPFAVTVVLVAWGMTVAALAAQGRSLRRFPALGLRTTTATASRLVVRLFTLSVLVALLAFLAFPPMAAAGLVLGVQSVLLLHKTLLVDLALLRAMVRALERGDLPSAAGFGLRLTTLVRRHPPGLVVANVARVTAATLAAHTGLEAAERVLSATARVRFPVDVEAWGVTLDLARYRIALGRLEEASKALDACAAKWSPPHHEMREMRRLLHARIDAASGAPDKALADVGDREGREWDLVRAHAFAAQGRTADARAALGRAADGEGGQDTLRAVADRAGPASDLARAVLREQGTPYRSQ